MTTLLLLLVFPLAWPVMAKLIWKHEYTFAELFLNVCVGVIIVTVGWYAGKFSQVADREVLNGEVVSKASEQVTCEHTYSCNCRQVCSGSGDRKSCSTQCDTCRDHAYDVDWSLKTTLGDIKISRVDRRGLTEPPRFSVAKPGDPVADTHLYTNYIKGSPDSLFNTLQDKAALAKYKDKIPEYPLEIYDYHYLNRVLSLGVPVPEVSSWNLDLAMRLRKLGPQKQVNLIVLFTKEADQAFADALRVAWLGGKKNDVIVVLGTPSYPEIQWTRVISWTDKEVFKVQLRDALWDLKTVDQKTVLDTIERHVVKDFERKKMEDFKYLEAAIEPPGWVIALLAVISVIASVGLSLYLSQNKYSSRGYSSGYGSPLFRRFRR